MTAATVSINSGPPIPLINEGDFFEIEGGYGSVGEMETQVPSGGSYAFAITGGPNGSTTLTGPGGTYANNTTSTPVFSIAGVSGTWSIGAGGIGVFSFDPTTVASSFTITLNAYSSANPGSAYAYFASVANINSGYTFIDEAGDGPIPDTTPATATTLTFTKDLADNAGDGDASTYGFVSGSVFEIEGGFFNVLGLTNTSFGDGSQQAFVVGQTTRFQLQAIPEPSSFATIAGAAMLALAGLRRRRSV